MLRITHIINPVKVSAASDLHRAQPITFESFRRAKLFAEATISDAKIQLCTAQFAEDHEIVPSHFHKTNDLQRSVIDVFGESCKKKLPLIADILNSAKTQLNDSDFLIYSNVDIAVQPYFYNSIIALIKNGYDAIAVNRRTISEEISDLNLLYGAKGEYHVGVDCFVFSKAIFNKFHLEKGFVGSGPVGMFFCLNMVAHAEKFIWIENEHLTFHLGDDKSWLKNDSLQNLRMLNYQELIKVCEFYLRTENAKNNIQHFSQTLKDFCLFHQQSPEKRRKGKRPDHRAALRALSQSIAGFN